MVLENGCIVEFDSPSQLLALRGQFYIMVRDSRLNVVSINSDIWWPHLYLHCIELGEHFSNLSFSAGRYVVTLKKNLFVGGVNQIIVCKEIEAEKPTRLFFASYQQLKDPTKWNSLLHIWNPRSNFSQFVFNFACIHFSCRNDCQFKCIYKKKTIFGLPGFFFLWAKWALIQDHSFHAYLFAQCPTYFCQEKYRQLRKVSL